MAKSRSSSKTTLSDRSTGSNENDTYNKYSEAFNREGAEFEKTRLEAWNHYQKSLQDIWNQMYKEFSQVYEQIYGGGDDTEDQADRAEAWEKAQANWAEQWTEVHTSLQAEFNGKLEKGLKQLDRNLEKSYQTALVDLKGQVSAAGFQKKGLDDHCKLGWTLAAISGWQKTLLQYLTTWRAYLNPE